MQTPLPYVAPSKGLIRSLQGNVRTLAHERLADTLRWYQTHHAVDDETMANQMNACPNVIGIRGRKHDDAHAPISPAKIARFKDRRTRPQTQTLAQMTAFFGETLNMPPFLFWTDLDDVMTAFHDARRFRKDRTRKDLIALTDGWLLSEFQTPHCTMAFQLTPLANNPIILVRGRIALFNALKPESPWTRTARHDAFVCGYATLTPKNLNLYLRDEQRRQVIVTLDVDAGPFEDDSHAAPYLVIRQASFHLPPEFDATLPKLLSKPRTVRSRKQYIRDLTAFDYSGRGQAHIASFFSFGKPEWDSIQRTPASAPELKEIRDSLDPALAGLGLLTPAKTRSRKAREDATTHFWRSVHSLRNLIQATANR
jgi:hypothetical protein